VSSLSLSPPSQLDVPRVDGRRRLSNVEQISDRRVGSTTSLGIPTSRLEFRRHSASPEPLMQQLSSSSNDEKNEDGSTTNCISQPLQFLEHTNQNSLSKPYYVKTNGYSSQEHHHQQLNHQRFLSTSTSRMAGLSPSQPTHLSYQHHHSTDNIDGSKLTFKGKGAHKISTNNNLSVHDQCNVQLLSSKKFPSLDQGVDVRWEVSRGRN